MVKLRLKRCGRKQHATYRIVAIDVRSRSCLAPLGILYLPTCVGFAYRYPFVEGRSSFSWDCGMGYFSPVGALYYFSPVERAGTTSAP